MLHVDAALQVKVERLYATYAWAVDQGDFDLLDSIITEDITITRGGVEIPGHEAFVEVYRNSWSGDFSASRHYISNIMAIREADGSIRGRAYFNAVFVRSDRTTMIVGRYEDTIVERDDIVLLSDKRIMVEGVVELPESAREWGGKPLVSR